MADTCQQGGYTALIAASFRGHTSVVHALLADARVDVNLQNNVSWLLLPLFLSHECAAVWRHCPHLGRLQGSRGCCSSAAGGCKGGCQSQEQGEVARF